MYQPLKVILISFIIFSTSFSKAQFFVNQYHKIGTKEGLSQNIIHTFFQDSRGFMWIGTNEGLNFYDGYKMTVYKNDSENPHSLRSNIILAITEDSKGFIWVLTAKGVEQFNPQNERFRYFATQNEGKYEFLNFVKGNAHNLWIGTNKGLLSFNVKTQKYEYFETYEDKENQKQLIDIAYLYADKSEGVWIANYHGDIYYKKPKSKSIYKKWTQKLKNDNTIMGLWFDEKNQNLWFASGTYELNILNLKTQTVTKLKRQIGNKPKKLFQPYGVLFQDSKGMVWTITTQGVIQYNPNTLKVVQELRITEVRNTKTAIYSLFIDKSGLLWLGTNGEGIIQTPLWNSKQLRVFQPNDKIDNTLSYNSVRAIYEDEQSRVWIGGYGPLEIFEKNGNKITLYDPSIERYPKFQIVYSITEDAHEPEKYLWLGFEGYGFLKFDKTTLKTIKHYFPESINESDSKGIYYTYDIYSSKNNIIWTATKAGLLKFDTQTEKYTLFKATKYNQNPLIKYILPDKNGNLWLGTASNGLVHFDIQKEKFKYYIPDRKQRQGLVYPINCIYADAQQNLWLASAGDGLYFFDSKQQTFLNYKQKDGLPSETIYGILPDKENNLWLSTLKGIAKFNTRSYQTEVFGAENGLQDEEFNTASFFQAKDGRMFFGGVNGVNTFYPPKLKKNLSKTQVILREVRIANKILDLPKPIENNQSITLSYHEAKFVKLTFTSQNYYKAHKSQYAYRIREDKEGWIFLGTQNHLTLSNLAPGNYTLEIKGANNDGIWNHQDKMILKIKVKAVYWQTWLFRILIALLVIIVLISFYKIRVKSIQKQKRNLEKIVKQRTQELLEKNDEIQEQANKLRKNNEKLLELGEFKEVLTHGIVHDLKNPLNVLLNVSEGFVDEGKRKMIQQTSATMLNMVLNILDVQKFEETEVKLNIEKIDLNNLIEEAKTQVDFLLKEKFLILHTYIPPNIWVSIDISLMVRVLVNLLTNAIKHSPNNGRIDIFVEKHLEKKEAKVSIRDEGIGIEQAQITEIFKKFKQFGRQTQSKIRSTGLGLTFSKMAVEAHGKNIEVASIPHKETIFSFTLPMSTDLPTGKHNQTNKDQTLEVAWNMSSSEKQVFQDYIQDLKNKEVYEISDIQQILSQIDFTKSDNLSDWYKKMENTLYTCNSDMYLQLIEAVEI